MQGTVSLPRPRLMRRGSLGQDDVAKPVSAFQPLMDKVGVPLLWVGLGIGIGYILASRPKRAS